MEMLMRLALILVSLLAAVGCSDDLAAQESLEQTAFDGAVHLPLFGHTADGKTFRLRNATYEIAGPAMFTLTDRDLKDPQAEALITTLPAGQYNVFLRPGWQLVEIAADGSEVARAATLASDNPVPFSLGRTADKRIKIKLHAGERELVLGDDAQDRVTSADLSSPY
jgi:hypothetical protein